LSGQISIRLLTSSRNLGFAGGVNDGASIANGGVLLLLNPDAIPEPGAVSALLESLTRSKAVAAGGNLLDADGHPEIGFVFRSLPTISSLLFEVLLVNQLWPRNPVNRDYRCLDADYSQEQLVEQPAGACLAVTREAWNAVGGMDVNFYPVWFEDVDLCARLKSIGQIVYSPASRFHHSGAHSVGGLSYTDRQVFWYLNMLRYARKHFSSGSVLVLRAGILIGMVLRTLACMLGGKPDNVPLSIALRSYWRVATMALGPG
jgi:GT2 family glycosyltransferase